MPSPSSPEVIVYTDGGADPNPGPGGWGVVLLDPQSERVKELSGGEPRTTNNRMELTAAIRALEALRRRSRIALYTDSTYLRRGVCDYLPDWERRGWRRATGELVNVDLWQRLAALIKEHEVRWHWVKGHAGERWNERADQLATAATREQQLVLGQRASSRGADAALPSVAGGAVEVFLRVATPAGRAGWVAMLRERGEETLISGAVPAASANALDLVAAIAALSRLPAGKGALLYTGSDYLRNGAREWLGAWQRRGWKTKEGAAVKNRELWEELATLLARRQVGWPEPDGEALAVLEQLAPLARTAAREANS